MQHVDRNLEGVEIKTDVDVLTDVDCISMDDGDLRSGISKMIDDRIGQVIDGAPEQLDTLKELADELGKNQSGVSTILKKMEDKLEAKDLTGYAKTVDVDNKLKNKVEAIDGKGLSSRDYTASDKSKVDALDALSSDKKLVYKQKKNVDFNTITEGGIYSVQSNVNAPHSQYNYWSLLVMNSTGIDNNSYVQQIAINEKIDDRAIYVRKKSSNWSSWIKLEEKADLSGYLKSEALEEYAKSADVDDKIKGIKIPSKLSELNNDKGFKTEKEIQEMIDASKGSGGNAGSVKYRTMTAVIDQSNSNPLTCISYEDDAKTMVKGSKDWDEFFKSQLVLFKGGKEVRELKDSELSGLSDADGDVMVRFKRMGLNIKTVGDKIYVSMTDNPDDANFKYYAHSRGSVRKEAFYLGAYLGYEQSGKLRSIKGYKPTGNKTIGDFRNIARANGSGYELMAFYQLLFVQCMYILKYGSLDSQTALGRGLTGLSGSESNCKNTGGTIGKGVDFGSTDGGLQMRFQYLEDLWGNKYQWMDGFGTKGGSLWIGNDNFNNDKSGYKQYSMSSYSGYQQKAVGSSEQGFVASSASGSETTYYCDYSYYNPGSDYFALVGGNVGSGGLAGVFCCYCNYSSSEAYWYLGARLMFI